MRSTTQRTIWLAQPTSEAFSDPPPEASHEHRLDVLVLLGVDHELREGARVRFAESSPITPGHEVADDGSRILAPSVCVAERMVVRHHRLLPRP